MGAVESAVSFEPHTNPWRDVVHIEIASPGKHGARPWRLTLSCGHSTIRSRGDTMSLRRAETRLFRPVKLAPKRVRCMFCKNGPQLRVVK